MKIVATYIPDDFITDNEEIKKLLEQRKLAQSKEEERKYTRLAIVELGKEFYNDLANDEEFLNKIGLNVIPDSNKHKRKTNGYEAEHIKFYGSSNPEYTLEMQFKSEDVENITRANGSASHEKRPGKSRILPCSENDKDLKKKLEYQVPIYTTFRKEGNKIVPHKQSMLKNVIAYFQEQIDITSDEYDKILSLYSNEYDR